MDKDFIALYRYWYVLSRKTPTSKPTCFLKSYWITGNLTDTVVAHETSLYIASEQGFSPALSAKAEVCILTYPVPNERGVSSPPVISC